MIKKNTFTDAYNDPRLKYIMPFNDDVVVEWISSAMNSHVNNRFNQLLFRYISYYRSKVHYMIHQFTL